MAIDTQATEMEIDPDNEANLPFDRYYHLRVEQYRRMVEVDILGPDDHVELLEGLIVEKMTKNPPHAVATELLALVLHRAVPEGWFPSIETPVSIPEQDCVPEPDAKVVRGQPRDYLDRWYGPRDSALVIEVSDSNYAEDRSLKWAIYARALVPIFWSLNLKRRRLEVYTNPTGEADMASYRQAQTFGPDGEAP